MKKLNLTKTQNTILSAAFVLSVTSSINAILGFLKNRLLASYFGVSNELAIFYTADRIPNLIYSVLIVGAVSTVFIPTFANLRKKDEAKAFSTATSIILCVFSIFIFLGGIIYAKAPFVIKILSLGKFSPAEVALGVNIMRIMLLSQIFLVAGSLITSILQSYRYFIVPALAPVFYNIGMIIGTILFSNNFGIYGPTYGVVIGALLHLGIQIPLLLKSGFRFETSKPLGDSHFIKAMGLVPPRIVQVALSNGVQTINNSLALIISASSVVYLKFATQLQSFPVSIFGISMAAAALPTLAIQSDSDSMTTFKKSLYTSLHQMFFLVMPISAILFVLRVPAVRIVYGASNFPWEATIKTSYALAFFSLSIFSQSANYVLTRAFFALKNTKTPVLISLSSAVINVLISIFFITALDFGVWSIALAYSLTSLYDTILLVFFLDKETGGLGLKNIIVPFSKISYSTILMAITLYAGLKILDIRILDTTKTLNLLILTFVTSVAGLGTYLVFTKLFKVEEIELFYKLVRKLNVRRFIKSKKYTEIPQNQVN